MPPAPINLEAHVVAETDRADVTASSEAVTPATSLPTAPGSVQPHKARQLRTEKHGLNPFESFVSHSRKLICSLLSLAWCPLLPMAQQSLQAEMLSAGPACLTISIPAMVTLTGYLQFGNETSFATSSQSDPNQKESHDHLSGIRITELPPKDSYDKAAFWANILLAVAGIAGICVAIRSLRAAEKSARLAEQGLTRVQRAFVYKSALKHVAVFDPRTNAPFEWRVSIQWRNSGSTPALKTITHLNVTFRPDQLPYDFSFPDHGFGDIPSVPSYLGPGAEAYSTEFHLDLERARQIKAESIFCYFWGWYEYYDVFQENDRHRSEFCFQLKIFGDPFPAEIYFIEVQVPLHNGSDEYSFHRPKQRGALEPIREA